MRSPAHLTACTDRCSGRHWHRFPINAAIQQAEQKHPGIPFKCADISDLTGAYDLITARLVHPVVKDQAGLLAAASRLLRPGGRLAIIAPLAAELTKRQHVGLTDEHLQQLANWSDRMERYEHEGLHALLCRRKPEVAR
ncbi:class I SAM-dependent methyltransferase [Streptomyces sp. NBC_00316]|uniref:class I SAM-dependent methyltransferase n=1 Tax=Streptomyces sp. NBC_00316 TaxID=2975710 RepID=UPI002E2AF7AC|nr:class I SAM-dependent methyltransferase [Streptomyces sp. NBC_00316]